MYPSLLLIATESASPIRRGVSEELATPSPPQPKSAAATHASAPYDTKSLAQKLLAMTSHDRERARRRLLL
eukprot:COSAG06_NODE_26470_length_614_cov_0.840777_1_plen_70_part_10